jgi:hypothetical protein
MLRRVEQGPDRAVLDGPASIHHRHLVAHERGAIGDLSGTGAISVGAATLTAGSSTRTLSSGVIPGACRSRARAAQGLRCMSSSVGRFVHDFENVQFTVREFDARLGTPGLHDVGRTVRVEVRNTILPPDLFNAWRLIRSSAIRR